MSKADKLYTMTKVFISYSHDSDAHREWVLNFSDRLREDGIDSNIDQYINGAPAEGWQRWMEEQIEIANFVLVICTPLYLKRFNGKDREGGRGVNFEGVIISQVLYDGFQENTKFIPVIPDDGSLGDVPLLLKSGTTYKIYEAHEDLYRVLTDQPRSSAKPLGKLKSLPKRNANKVAPPALSDSDDKTNSPEKKPKQQVDNTRVNWKRWLIIGLTGTAVLIGIWYTYQKLSAPEPGQPISLAHNITLMPIPPKDLDPDRSFQMGGKKTYQQPIHKVTFTQPFWMSQTEITVAQYQAFVDSAPTGSKGGANLPITKVNIDDANRFAESLTNSNGKNLLCRLPSEAEWEYAARAGSTAAYSWGDQEPKDKATCKGCDNPWSRSLEIAPVGSFKANKFGLHDMHGNAEEWVQDAWHDDYEGAPSNGLAWKRGGSATKNVVRGGSWADPAENLQSAERGKMPSKEGSATIGFRVVCTRKKLN